MLLTLTTTYQPATDIGYLLHKNPNRCQETPLPFGKAFVLYPEATDNRCTVALLLDIDPIQIVRGKPGMIMGGPLDQYVNDRPYAASSFLSVALARVFGDALRGKCKSRPDLLVQEMPLEARISVLPCRQGGEGFLRKLFEPLGYMVQATRHILDEKYTEWGESPYFTVSLAKKTTLQEVLTHLYVLIPVLDNSKHYYVGDAEVDKLLTKGERWLASHPEREQITRRYLKYQPSLARQALSRLVEEDQPLPVEPQQRSESEEDSLEMGIKLNEARIGAVLAALKGSGARRILDLGCGEGKLLRELFKDKQFDEIVGMDVSVRSLEIASERLHLDRLSPKARGRIRLIHGSLLYRDRRLEGFEAAAVIEVIEHLNAPRLEALERVVFEFIRPRTIVITTPNREYNAIWNLDALDGDSAPRLRHRDHRFEWTRSEFSAWANQMAERFNYAVRFLPVGQEDSELGPPTQMACFELKTE